MLSIDRLFARTGLARLACGRTLLLFACGVLLFAWLLGSGDAATEECAEPEIPGILYYDSFVPGIERSAYGNDAAGRMYVWCRAL